MAKFEATPTLIIGIGGTGLKAATQAKKTILEMNQNQMPREVAILVIDTEKDIKYRAGGWGRTRSEGQSHATGPVGINPAGEYVPLIGNVKSRGTEIMDEQTKAEADPSVRRDQPNRHISSWFQSKYYITDLKAKDLIWTLEVGAGRLRQFGRLALFERLERATTLIGGSLQAIRNANATSVSVHIVGSLAGGTGSALYADIPHLVNLLAKSAGFRNTIPVIVGHFVLTEAFSGTDDLQLSQDEMKDDFDARVYAGLRELTRLQGVTLDSPYPMIYDPRGTGKLSARLDKALYSSVYLYDGHRTNNPLSDKKIEDGIAPTIADAIVAYVDGKSAGAFVSHSVNYEAASLNNKNPAGTVTYGSLGTYTIELPIYHITEGWTHDLARSMMDTLLAPGERDPQSQVPLNLIANQPGGSVSDPHKDVDNWLVSANTTLVAKLAEWGKTAAVSNNIKSEKIKEILNQDASVWKQLMAPNDPQWAAIVQDAQLELEASLNDETQPKYFVSLNPMADSATQRALNLQQDTEARLVLMVGKVLDVWQREGGEFRNAMRRLVGKHARDFSEGLVKWLQQTLNGNVNVASAIERNRGKLGYAQAFLIRLDEVLKAAYGLLLTAQEESQKTRRGIWDSLISERLEAADKMNSGGGLFSRNYRNYREKSDELAQFHKADIARAVALGLMESLKITVEQALADLNTWQRVLATATLAEGGAYALVADGKREVEVDRQQSKNNVRWVIDDAEGSDTYIKSKREQYETQALERLMSNVSWGVGLVDGRGPLRIDFRFNNSLWDRDAGQKGKQQTGVKNVTGLLKACRAVYEKAWDDMSVTDYLYKNYGDTPESISSLAKRIYNHSGCLLSTIDGQLAPMRTTYMRVYKTKLSTETLRFLSSLREEVASKFGEKTTAQLRAKQEDETKTEKEGQIGGKSSEEGQDSQDRFKLNFVMFGDLLSPKNIKAYQGAQAAYHMVSGQQGDKWCTLHIFPAETHALEIERGLTNGPQQTQQKRRELVEDVVRALEDMDTFRLAMRCLAYGDESYDWGVTNPISGKDERGQLLYLHTNEEGKSHWRLRLQPQGDLHNDGKFYTPAGMLALPEDYQLTATVDQPELLQAFVQMVCAGQDFNTKTRIDWLHVAATLKRIMQEHGKRWHEGKNKGWVALSQTERDARLMAEAQTCAGQIIRLTALVGKADRELAKHSWAWKPGAGNPPADLKGEAEIVKVQRRMDLWTALRAVAQQEMTNFNTRFARLAKWQGVIPDERIEIHSDGLHTKTIKNAGKETLVLPPDVSKPPVIDASDTAPKIVQLNNDLKTLVSDKDLYDDQEYVDKRNEILTQIAALETLAKPDEMVKPADKPTKPADKSTKASIEDKTLGIISPEPAPIAPKPPPVGDVRVDKAPPAPTPSNEPLAKLERRAKRAKERLEDGELTQADYEREMAEIQRLRQELTSMSREMYEAQKIKLDRREKRLQEELDDEDITASGFQKRMAALQQERVALEQAYRASRSDYAAQKIKLDRREQRLQEEYDDGGMTKEEHRERLGKLKQEREALEALQRGGTTTRANSSVNDEERAAKRAKLEKRLQRLKGELADEEIEQAEFDQKQASIQRELAELG